MFRIDRCHGQKKTVKILGETGDFSAHPVNRESMDPRQQSAITPLLLRRVGLKFAAQQSFRFERQQCGIDLEAIAQADPLAPPR